MTPTERLAAWKAVRACVEAEDGSVTYQRGDIVALSNAETLIEEQIRQAAFDVVRLERFAQLRAENPNKRAALLADRARAWVSQHPEAWEGLL